MTDPLSHLVYYSRNRLRDNKDEVAVAVQSILDKSRLNNALVGVTGALMFNSGCFAQVLEGPQSEVERVFERIQQDERHGDVALLALEPIDRRSFASWSMGFVGASLPDAARYREVATASGFDPSRMSGTMLFETLLRLAIEEENSLY